MEKKLAIKVVIEGGQGEIEEKRSRFIGYMEPVETEEEALAFIAKMKKQNWDARHNCSAYTIGEDNQIMRCSDDGEPSQTAGRPMLDVLLGEEIHNVVLVVTRYFGGILLGTGGLVRAYQQAAKAAIENSRIVTRYLGHELELRTDYNSVGKIQYITRQMGVTEKESEYTDVVKMTVLVKNEILEKYNEEIVEGTNGKTGIVDNGEVYFS